MSAGEPTSTRWSPPPSRSAAWTSSSRRRHLSIRAVPGDGNPSCRRVLRVNLFSVFAAMQAAKQMIAQGRGGKIINVSSIDALHPSMVGLAHYDASKHGVWGLTENVALEFAEHEITVNALAPGAIATPGRQQRHGRSRDAARNRGAHPDAQGWGFPTTWDASRCSSPPGSPATSPGHRSWPTAACCCAEATGPWPAPSPTHAFV